MPQNDPQNTPIPAQTPAETGVDTSAEDWAEDWANTPDDTPPPPADPGAALAALVALIGAQGPEGARAGLDALVRGWRQGLDLAARLDLAQALWDGPEPAAEPAPAPGDDARLGLQAVARSAAAKLLTQARIPEDGAVWAMLTGWLAGAEAEKRPVSAPEIEPLARAAARRLEADPTRVDEVLSWLEARQSPPDLGGDPGGDLGADWHDGAAQDGAGPDDDTAEAEAAPAPASSPLRQRAALLMLRPWARMPHPKPADQAIRARIAAQCAAMAGRRSLEPSLASARQEWLQALNRRRNGRG